MERRYRVRLRELLDDAVVAPEQVQGMLAQLEEFVKPFAASLVRRKQRILTQQYVGGLVSRVERKNVESIAYHHDQDRQMLQKFVGQYTWDHRPMVGELVRQVGGALGRADAVLVFDPSAFPKKGDHSVGVQRQWCGRLGKVDNCQVGVFMAYVSADEHALVDTRLYLPKSWTCSKSRRAECGVPKDVTFRTRHQLALEMLDQHGPSCRTPGWPETTKWEKSRVSRRIDARRERYLLAVPSNTLVRDLIAEPPSYSGHGPRPKSPWVRVDRWCKALSEEDWTSIDVRDAERGPLIVEAVKIPVQAKTAPGEGIQETLVVIRERQADGSMKHDYYLSNAPHDITLAEFTRVSKAEHRIEECLQRAKSEAGLADYEVSHLAWLAPSSNAVLGRHLVPHAGNPRGKKIHAGITVPQVRAILAALLHRKLNCDHRLSSVDTQPDDCNATKGHVLSLQEA